MRKLTNRQQSIVRQDAVQQWHDSCRGQLYIPVEISDEAFDELVKINDYETLYHDANRYLDDCICSLRLSR